MSVVPRCRQDGAGCRKGPPGYNRFLLSQGLLQPLAPTRNRSDPRASGREVAQGLNSLGVGGLNLVQMAGGLY